MPVQKIRRLDVPTTGRLFDRLSMEALSCPYGASDLDTLERAHPELIIEHEGNALAALGHGDVAFLAYAFTSTRAFCDSFDVMFEKLLPRVREAYGSDTVRFRLTYGPSRPAIEPVLRRLSFTPSRSWLQFSLARGTKPITTLSPSGVTFRAGTIADLDVLVDVDHEAFPNTPMPRAVLRGHVEEGGRFLVAVRKGVPVGFSFFENEDAEGGYLRTLAVREAARGQGIGAALTLRTAKAVFAEGAPRLDLRTDDDNTDAIRLYNWLGFKNTGAGRDYERPVDSKVIARMREANEGTFIKFGGWR